MEEVQNHIRRIKTLCRHINNVQSNCELLGERLIETGELELGRKLIANGYVHDNSKFFGIEYDYILDDGVENKEAQVLAIQQHRSANFHHVEHWTGGIADMPDVYIAEMVCDLKARSSEFGTSIVEYIDNVCIQKWNITKEDLIYEKIMRFVNILLDKPFENIEPNKINV